MRVCQKHILEFSKRIYGNLILKIFEVFNYFEESFKPVIKNKRALVSPFISANPV